MTFHDVARLVRQRWLLFVVLPVLGFIAANVASAVLPTTYLSSASVLVSWREDANAADYQQASQATVTRAATFASLATSDEILQDASRASGLDLDDLRRGVTVAARDEQAYLDINATAGTAAAARDAAQAVAEVLSRRLPVIDGGGVDSPLVLTITSPANLPEVAASPRPRNNAALGILGGLALALTAALALHSLDSRVRSAHDVVPGTDEAGVVVLASERGRRSESRRRGLDQLRDRVVRHQRTVVLITAADVEAAGSPVVEELARGAARLGRHVVVVHLGAGAEPAAADADAAGVRQVRLPVEPGSTAAFGRLEVETRGADLVLLVAPPVLSHAEARSMAPAADVSVLLVRSGRTTRSDARAATTLLSAHERRPVIVIDHSRRTVPAGPAT